MKSQVYNYLNQHLSKAIKMGKLKAILWVAFTPLAMLPGVLFALTEYDWGLQPYLHNARVYWYGGDYCDHEGRVFKKSGEQLYPKPALPTIEKGKSPATTTIQEGGCDE